MTWIYDLILDKNFTIGKSMMLVANILIGIIFSFAFTISFFEYAWALVPSLSSLVNYFVNNVLEILAIL